MSRLGVSSMLRVMVMAVAAYSSIEAYHQAYADDAGLSREAIMRQHHHLAQQTGEGESTSESSLAPPLSSSVTGNSSSQGRADSNELVTRLLERVSSLEGQVRTLRGDVDQLTNQVHQDEANTSKQLSDMQFAQQEASAHHVPAKVAPQNDSHKAPPLTAAENLQKGSAALKAHHYAEAERHAREALQTAHSSSGKTEAQFLLAQALAGQKSYRQAAVAYYDTYSKNPQSKRAPEALLGVSGAMLGLNNKPAACEALQRLKHEFPNASERVKASEKVFRSRASCH